MYGFVEYDDDWVLGFGVCCLLDSGFGKRAVTAMIDIINMTGGARARCSFNEVCLNGIGALR